MDSFIKERAKAYYFDTGSKTVAVLMHGFTGSPDDMRELAKYLVSKNISVKVPLLAGHGSHWTALEKTTAYDWWKTLDDEVKELATRYEKIFIIGYSFGANLALDMAARYPQKISGVVTLGVSVFLRSERWARLLMPLYNLTTKRYRKSYIKKEHLADYEDSGCYSVVPTIALREMYKFIDTYTKRELGQIKVPVFIIHSQDDSVTDPSSSEYVYQMLNTPDKEMMMLDEFNHNPLQSKRKDMIFSKIEEFIKKWGG